MQPSLRPTRLVLVPITSTASHAGARVGRAGPRHGDRSIGCTGMCSSAPSARAAKGFDELLRQPQKICVRQVDVHIPHVLDYLSRLHLRIRQLLWLVATCPLFPALLRENQAYFTRIMRLCEKRLNSTMYDSECAHMDKTHALFNESTCRHLHSHSCMSHTHTHAPTTHHPR